MEEVRIKFDTAKLAKEKGFDTYTNSYYNTAEPDIVVICGAANWNYKAWDFTTCSAPTQSLLQKWLRDVHKIHVRADNVNDPVMNKWYFEIQKLPAGIYHLWSPESIVYDTYEEALEAGLIEGLNLITNN